MQRALDAMRWLTVLGLVTGLGLLLAPVTVDVEPLHVGILADSIPVAASARTSADSLTEDIILHNLFASSRTAPTRRYSPGNAATQDPGSEVSASSMSSSFTPELIGTAVSEKPGETRALLRLVSSDPAPRLYSVGDKAGGFSVVSIEARSVVLSGPRGRVVLRLPESEEIQS